MGGSLSCLNGGICLKTGFCECRLAYTGSTCSEYSKCECVHSKKIK